MANDGKVHIHIDADRKRDGLSEYNQFARCPTCGGEQETGFGLAGGGFGIYTYCPRCEAVTSKSEVDD